MGNGLVEKFNEILKMMLKRICQEKPRNRDTYVTPLLFDYRGCHKRVWACRLFNSFMVVMCEHHCGTQGAVEQ